MLIFSCSSIYELRTLVAARIFNAIIVIEVVRTHHVKLTEIVAKEWHKYYACYFAWSESAYSISSILKAKAAHMAVKQVIERPI